MADGSTKKVNLGEQLELHTKDLILRMKQPQNFIFKWTIDYKLTSLDRRFDRNNELLRQALRKMIAEKKTVQGEVGDLLSTLI